MILFLQYEKIAVREHFCACLMMFAWLNNSKMDIYLYVSVWSCVELGPIKWIPYHIWCTHDVVLLFYLGYNQFREGRYHIGKNNSNHLSRHSRTGGHAVTFLMQRGCCTCTMWMGGSLTPIHKDQNGGQRVTHIAPFHDDQRAKRSLKTVQSCILSNLKENAKQKWH